MKLERELNPIHQEQTLYSRACRGGERVISEIPPILSEPRRGQVTACLWRWWDVGSAWRWMGRRVHRRK
jgi:hypothetical protein